MKALFINGSPRKKFNTAQMLESAMKGAADAGAYRRGYVQSRACGSQAKSSKAVVEKWL